MALKHRRTIREGFSYNLCNQPEYDNHAKLIARIGRNYTGWEGMNFEIDERNAKILKFLLYYFNGCPLAEEVFPGEGYKLHKNLLLIGSVGTGKTLLMHIFSDYLNITKNPLRFHNLSVTQMMNYYKLNSHIDRYTYNEEKSKSFEGRPIHICLNDIGVQTEEQKHYGTDVTLVIDEFLHARYEIYQHKRMRYHLTSNMAIEDFKKRYEARLIDRFKSFNVISMTGKSRRK